MNFTEEERAAYEDHLKWLLVEANTLKKFGDKAREEGIQIGEVGLIKKMITNGNPIETISKMTGVSVSEIKKLI